MTTPQQYTLESLTTGERRTVEAVDHWAALDSWAEPCLAITQRPDGKYSAFFDEQDGFLCSGVNVANTAEEAAIPTRRHYAAIQAHIQPTG